MEAPTADERKIRRRVSEIERRLAELSDLWDFACSTDAEYRMVEYEQEALRMERTKLLELKADL